MFKLNVIYRISINAYDLHDILHFTIVVSRKFYQRVLKEKLKFLDSNTIPIQIPNGVIIVDKYGNKVLDIVKNGNDIACTVHLNTLSYFINILTKIVSEIYEHCKHL